MNYYELLIKRSRSVEPPAPPIPTDYAFYAPLTSTSATTDETGKPLSYSGTMSAETDQGINCLFINQGSYIFTADITGITSGDHSFTMSIWFRKANTQYGSHDIVFALGKNASYKGMLMGYQNGHPYYSTYGYDVETNVAMDTLWHCYTYTYDSSTTTFCLYIDGTMVKTTTASGKRNLDSTGKIAIGGQFGNMTPPQGGGWYASARIYDRCITIDEIQLIANEFSDESSSSGSDSSSSSGSDSSSSSGGVIPTDYMFYASLTSPSATTAESGQTLTYASGTPLAATVDGIPCLNMSGAYMTASDTGINMGTNPITLCVWAYGLSNSPWCSLLQVGTGSAGKMFLVGQMGGNYHICGQMHSYSVESDVSILNAWHCIVFTRNGYNYALYIDGVQKATLTESACSAVSSGYIGMGGNTDPNYNGYLTKARIYNRVLSASEIQAIADEFNN